MDKKITYEVWSPHHLEKKIHYKTIYALLERLRKGDALTRQIEGRKEDVIKGMQDNNFDFLGSSTIKETPTNS